MEQGLNIRLKYFVL